MEAIFREHAVRRAVLHRDRLLRRDAGHQLRPAGRLGRSARSSSRTSPSGLFPKLFAHPGPARLRLQSALAGPEPDRQAGAVRPADLAALRGAAGGGRPADGGGAAEPGAAESRQRPEAQQAAAQGRDRPREGGPARHRRRDDRPHGRDHARRPPGHALQARRQAVRRHRPAQGRRPHQPGRSARDLRPRQRRRAWCRSPTWSRIEETVAPKELNHFNKLRAATITATLAPGYSHGRGAGLPRRPRPPSCRPGSSPTSTARAASSAAPPAASTSPSCWRWRSSISCWRPSSRAGSTRSIIMLTVPLSMTGALLALKLTGQSMNVYSQIGLVTLVGLITKHGILIVEFANQLQEQGRAQARRGGRGGDAAAAADPDDHGCHGAGLGAAGDRHRRRRGEPPGDRLGDRRRPAARARCSRSTSCRRPTCCWRAPTGTRAGGASEVGGCRLRPNRSGDQQRRAGRGAALERPMRVGGLREREALVDLDLDRAGLQRPRIRSLAQASSSSRVRV